MTVRPEPAAIPVRLEQAVYIAFRDARSLADAIRHVQQAGFSHEQARHAMGATVERRREEMLSARHKPALKNILTGLWGGVIGGGIWFLVLDNGGGLGHKPIKAVIVMAVGVVCAGMFAYGLWQRFSTVSDAAVMQSFPSPA